MGKIIIGIGAFVQIILFFTPMAENKLGTFSGWDIVTSKSPYLTDTELMWVFLLIPVVLLICAFLKVKSIVLGLTSIMGLAAICIWIFGYGDGWNFLPPTYITLFIYIVLTIVAFAVKNTAVIKTAENTGAPEAVNQSGQDSEQLSDTTHTTEQPAVIQEPVPVQTPEIKPAVTEPEPVKHNDETPPVKSRQLPNKKILLAVLIPVAAVVLGLLLFFIFFNRQPAQDEQTVYAIQQIPANFVHIPGGTFTMGSPAGEPGRDSDEGPQRQVTVSGFYLGKFQVTQQEYEEVMGNNPSHFRGSNLPVEMVNWFDAVEYCNRRSRNEGLTPVYTVDGTGNNRTVTWNTNANGYRLPTEAEWEYACRAGTATPFFTGNNITTTQANYNGNDPYNNNARGESREQTTPIGIFPANGWGLHDMHGNVHEWCWDRYGDYPGGPQTDPTGVSSGINRVLRGASWFSSGRFVRSAYRANRDPSYQSNYVGFRLVLQSDGL